MSMWKTTRFVKKGNYLHGSFIKQPEVDGYILSLNPGDLNDTIGKFPFSEASADIAVGCAREAFGRWHRTPLESRMLCMHRYRDQLASSIEQISAYLSRETGKPSWESHAEVLATIKRIDVTLEHGIPLLEGWRMTELEGGCEFHPRGVIAVLGPYNLPLLSPNIHIVSALLAGNVIVFKPSKYTPAVGQLIAEMIDRARFPRGVFNLVQGSGKVVGSRLAIHPDVDAVHLDGSLETAFELKRLTLEQPWKRLVLNTCGRGTAVVLDDADLDKAAYEIVVGAFLTTGQRRSSTSRVIATRSIIERLEQRMIPLIEGLTVGGCFDADVFVGPLISEASRKRYLLYLQATADEGHVVLVPGSRLDLEPHGYYVKPALIRIDPSISRKFLSSDDIVGPALELHVVDDFKEAVALHNRVRSGLVTSLFTRNTEYLREARYVFRTGALNLNRSTVSISARLPLEGQQGSSNGVSMGLFAVRSCSFPLSFLEDHKPFDRNAIMPGIHWPELDEDSDQTTTHTALAEDEDGFSERTISDLLIPQDEETTDGRRLPADLMAALARHDEQLEPPARGDRSGQGEGAAKDVPAARDDAAAKDASAANDDAAANDAPAARDDAAAKDAPAARDASSVKDAPATKEATAAKDVSGLQDGPGLKEWAGLNDGAGLSDVTGLYGASMPDVGPARIGMAGQNDGSVDSGGSMPDAPPPVAVRETGREARDLASWLDGGGEQTVARIAPDDLPEPGALAEASTAEGIEVTPV